MVENEHSAARYLNRNNDRSKETRIFRGIATHAVKAAVLGAIVGLAVGAITVPFVSLSPLIVLGLGSALGAGSAFGAEAVTEYALMQGVRMGYRLGTREANEVTKQTAQARTPAHLPPGSMRIDGPKTDYRSLVREERETAKFRSPVQP